VRIEASFRSRFYVRLPMSEPAISVQGFRKSYGENEAVRGIDFEVERGEVFGFLPQGRASG
jgi:ABC-type sugar transport system ATPase subunit